MALDPNIPLQRTVQPVNLLQAITSGVQAGNAIRLAPLLQEAQRLSNQAAQQSLQAGQMQMQGMNQQQALQSIGTLRNVAGQLLQMPSTQRATYLQQIAPQLQQLGIDPAQISASDLSDESLAGFVSRANAIMPPSSAEPVTLSQGEQLIDPSTGRVVAQNVTPTERQMEKDVNGVLRYVDNGQAVFPDQVPQSQNREIRNDAQGVARYVDTNEPVFPADAERVEQMAASAKNTILSNAEILQSEMEKAISLMQDAPAGRTGAIMATANPTGSSAQLRRSLETIRSRIGFDQLMQMKRESPTGGALGAVSERELSNLQAVLGNLDAMQSDEELYRVMRQVHEFYSGLVESNGGDPLPDLPSLQAYTSRDARGRMPQTSDINDLISRYAD